METGELVEVAFGSVLPHNKEQVSHGSTVDGSQFRVSVIEVVSGHEDEPLPVPRPDWSLNTLAQAQGSFVTWPRAWVRFSEEVTPTYFTNS